MTHHIPAADLKPGDLVPHPLQGRDEVVKHVIRGTGERPVVVKYESGWEIRFADNESVEVRR